MNDNGNDWSKPDYAAWKEGIQEVARLSKPRFYFVVTVVAIVTVAVAMTYAGNWNASLLLAILILIFGATAWFLQRKDEGDGREYEVGTAESSDQPIRTEAAAKVAKIEQCGERDRGDSTGSCGVRTPLECEAGRSKDLAAR